MGSSGFTIIWKQPRLALGKWENLARTWGTPGSLPSCRGYFWISPLKRVWWPGLQRWLGATVEHTARLQAQHGLAHPDCWGGTAVTSQQTPSVGWKEGVSLAELGDGGTCYTPGTTAPPG